MTTMPIIERFEQYVFYSPDGCHYWLGGVSGGRGKFYYNGILTTASKVSFEIYKSIIPIGFRVYRSCKNSLCVNPDHLSLKKDLTPAINRFLKNIYYSIDGCHYWTGSLNSNGYGSLTVDSKHTLAHRFAFLHYKGEIPKGLFVCHHCDNPKCVNPDHLFLGTNLDNVMDKVRKNRQSSLPGSSNPKSKLTETIVLDILKLDRVTSSKSIALQYGVSPHTIKDIRNGRTWKLLNPKFK